MHSLRPEDRKARSFHLAGPRCSYLALPFNQTAPTCQNLPHHICRAEQSCTDGLERNGGTCVFFVDFGNERRPISTRGEKMNRRSLKLRGRNPISTTRSAIGGTVQSGTSVSASWTRAV